jgi:hypothetical protein
VSQCVEFCRALNVIEALPRDRSPPVTRACPRARPLGPHLLCIPSDAAPATEVPVSLVLQRRREGASDVASFEKGIIQVSCKGGID